MSGEGLVILSRDEITTVVILPR